MLKYILCKTENSKLNILCSLCAKDCPVFKVKAKMNVFEPSDVINRSKLFTIKRFQRLVLSEARKRSNAITKQISFHVLGFLG